MSHCNHPYISSASNFVSDAGTFAGIMSTFGQRLELARKSKGMNKSELARSIGVAPQHVIQIERGTGELGIRPAVRAAEVLGVNIRWLALEEGPMTATPHHVPLTVRERDLLADFSVLLPERQDKYLEEIGADADNARRVIEHARRSGLLPPGPAVSDDEVGKHIKPAPSVPPRPRVGAKRK